MVKDLNFPFPEYIGGPWDGEPVQANVGDIRVPESPSGYYYWEDQNYIWMDKPKAAENGR
jgi:hypothetical protein